MMKDLENDELKLSVSVILQKNYDRFTERTVKHLGKLLELSEKSFRKITKLEELNEEQREWVERKLSGSTEVWRRWFE